MEGRPLPFRHCDQRYLRAAARTGKRWGSKRRKGDFARVAPSILRLAGYAGEVSGGGTDPPLRIKSGAEGTGPTTRPPTRPAGWYSQLPGHRRGDAAGHGNWGAGSARACSPRRAPEFPASWLHLAWSNRAVAKTACPATAAVRGGCCATRSAIANASTHWATGMTVATSAAQHQPPAPLAPSAARLLAKHREALYASGLSEETIATAGIYSAQAGDLEHVLGFRVSSAGIVIPYPDFDSYARVRLDWTSDGKRYRTARGNANHLYVPPTLDRAVLTDPSLPLYITEGEKKALKAVQDGLACIAIAGVWSWRGQTPEGQTAPLPDFDAITWRGRTVYLVFDSDLTHNADVARAETALARELARRGSLVVGVRLPEDSLEKLGLDDYLVKYSVEAFHALPTVELARPPKALGEGLGAFLERELPERAWLIDTILSADGGGWIAGEEKLGKTFYALAEALCLSLGRPVAERFRVPERQRVLVIEEEDPPRRVRSRLDALLRGLGLDPNDPAVRADLDPWFRLSVWAGFSLDSADGRQRLEAAIAEFRPAVVYLDAFRKMTLKDFNKQPEMAEVLAFLDELRRKYDVIFRVVHHFRKGQGGYRAGRGSQEIAGSQVLGAWAENSLFFEPVGRREGAVRVTIQSKDAPPQPPFRLVIESEGPAHQPTMVRVRAQDEPEGRAQDSRERIYEAVAALPPTLPLTGQPGVTLHAICAAVRCSEKTARVTLEALRAEGRVRVAGKTTKQANLWAPVGQ
jgi:hypothetical protein